MSRRTRRAMARRRIADLPLKSVTTLPSFRWVHAHDVEPALMDAVASAARYAIRDLGLERIRVLWFDADRSAPNGLSGFPNDRYAIALKRGRSPIDTAWTTLHECRHVRDVLDGYAASEFELQERAERYAAENVSGVVGDPNAVILGRWGPDLDKGPVF